MPTHAPASSAERREFVTVSLRINGQDHRLGLEERTVLFDALREHAGLAGSWKRCDDGQCGVCTVLVEGRRVLSCMSLAVLAEGHEITTIERFADGDGTVRPLAGYIRPNTSGPLDLWQPYLQK